MRLGDLDVLKEMLIKERDAIPLTRTERYGFGVEMPNPHGMSMRGGINKAFKCMEKVPTIEAIPLVHGRWIDGADSFGAKRGAFRVCSRCNICFPRDDAIVPPWFWQGCPNCFARMDGEEYNG